MKLRSLFFVLSMLLVACAVDRPPTGGPEDTAPLEIVSVSPPPSSVNISPERIVFLFNRHVQTASLKRSLTFSPQLYDYTLKTSGKKAEIIFTKPPEKNKTYTITLNASLRSYRGNRLKQSYTYAFSTGSRINRGVIGGQVFNNDTRPSRQALVLAWALPADTDPAAFNPLENQPDYSVLTGQNGKFKMEYLAEGTYRLLALQDINGNRKLDPEKESYAAGYRNAVRTGMLDNTFRLAEPQGPPRPVSSSATASNLLDITFDRSIAATAFNPDQLVVTDTINGLPVQLKGYYTISETPETRAFRIVTSPMNKQSVYRIVYGESSPIFCRGAGNTLKQSLSLTGISPPDGENTAFLTTANLDRPVTLTFSIPVEEQSIPKAVSLYELKEKDTLSLAFTTDALDSRQYRLFPKPAFVNGRTYHVEIEMNGITGLDRQKVSDSLATATFTVATDDDFGTISGTVSGEQAAVVLEVVDTRGKKIRSIVLPARGNKPSPFTINGLAPGKYRLRAFGPRHGIRHKTGSLAWYPGRIYPFEPADPFTVGSDTVTVRKGWETGQINLTFPSKEP